jgi:hypothetical protein
MIAVALAAADAVVVDALSVFKAQPSVDNLEHLFAQWSAPGLARTTASNVVRGTLQFAGSSQALISHASQLIGEHAALSHTPQRNATDEDFRKLLEFEHAAGLLDPTISSTWSHEDSEDENSEDELDSYRLMVKQLPLAASPTPSSPSQTALPITLRRKVGRLITSAEREYIRRPAPGGQGPDEGEIHGSKPDPDMDRLVDEACNITLTCRNCDIQLPVCTAATKHGPFVTSSPFVPARVQRQSRLN